MNRLQYKIHLIIENQSISEHEIIDELNSQEVTRLVPTILYLLLIIIVGIPGNGLVCYIYRSNYSASSYTWFIFFLAVVDLILCVFAVPGEIAAICFQYNFESAVLCKLLTCLSLSSLLSLGFTLVIVSIDRYRKVCRPLGSQIDFKKARILSVVAVTLAFVISIPVYSVYGIYQFDIDVGVLNVTAYECSIRQTASESSFPFYYVLFGMTMFTAALATICILYVIIGKNIKQHTNRETIKRNVSLTASMAKRHQVVKSLSSNIELKTVRNRDDNLPKIGVRLQSIRDSTSNEAEDSSGNLSREEDSCDFVKPMLPVPKSKPTHLEKTKSDRVRQRKARKATLSMFLISAAFVLSYLPLLSLMLAKTLVPGLTEMLSDSGRAVYVFFLRSCFFNYAINPFMYGIADSNFRRNCKSVLCKIYDRVLRFFGCRQ